MVQRRNCHEVSTHGSCSNGEDLCSSAECLTSLRSVSLEPEIQGLREDLAFREHRLRSGSLEGEELTLRQSNLNPFRIPFEDPWSSLGAAALRRGGFRRCPGCLLANHLGGALLQGPEDLLRIRPGRLALGHWGVRGLFTAELLN